jgi:hypothetical protein
MKRTFTLLVAVGAITLGPTTAFASPTRSPTSPPGQGQINGQGYNHMHTQAQAKGQPNQSCELSGTTPGNSASAPGGGSPFGGEDSVGGSHYAGSQPQNSRNTASVSQYDVACANQPH